MKSEVKKMNKWRQDGRKKVKPKEERKQYIKRG